MSRAHLLACPACARHVRVDEDACPFCCADLPSWFRNTALPAAPAARLSRAALHALRVSALSVTTAACGGTTVMPPYGQPPAPIDSGLGEEDAGTTEAAQPDVNGPSDAMSDVSGPGEASTAMDAGAEEAARPDANGSSDARSDVFIAPPYGIPLYGSPP
jgi:hypothetical protein